MGDFSQTEEDALQTSNEPAPPQTAQETVSPGKRGAPDDEDAENNGSSLLESSPKRLLISPPAAPSEDTPETTITEDAPVCSSTKEAASPTDDKEEETPSTPSPTEPGAITPVTTPSMAQSLHSHMAPSTTPAMGMGAPPMAAPAMSGPPMGGPPMAPAMEGVGPRAVEENRTTLWIGDLERWEDEEHIYHYFDQYFPGSITSVKISRDRDQQRSLGYGFIDFVSREVAERALASAPAFKRPHGRRFKLTWARGKTRQPFNPAVNPSRMSLAGMMGGPAPLGLTHTAHTPIAAGPYISHPPQLAATPPPFVPGAGTRWHVDIPKLPLGCSQQRLVEAILRPLGLDTCTILEPYDVDSLRLVFSTSNAFFAFIGRYRDGRFDLGAGVEGNYVVPPEVMESWTRMYEQSLSTRQASAYDTSAVAATAQWPPR